MAAPTKKQTVQLSAQRVAATPTDWMLPYASWHAHSQYLGRDNEAFKLLAHLATCFQGARFSTVGPGIGFSALALAHEAGERGNVATAFDTTDRVPSADSGIRTPRDHPAVRLRVVEDLASPAAAAEAARGAQLIVLDLEKHEGVQERAFVAALAAAGYKGLLVVDDIRLSPGMQAFWAELGVMLPGARLLDVSEMGHWSGTGIVAFDPSVLDVQVLPREPYSARDRLTGKLL